MPPTSQPQSPRSRKSEGQPHAKLSTSLREAPARLQQTKTQAINQTQQENNEIENLDISPAQVLSQEPTEKQELLSQDSEETNYDVYELDTESPEMNNENSDQDLSENILDLGSDFIEEQEFDQMFEQMNKVAEENFDPEVHVPLSSNGDESKNYEVSPFEGIPEQQVILQENDPVFSIVDLNVNSQIAHPVVNKISEPEKVNSFLLLFLSILGKGY